MSYRRGRRQCGDEKHEIGANDADGTAVVAAAADDDTADRADTLMKLLLAASCANCRQLQSAATAFETQTDLLRLLVEQLLVVPLPPLPFRKVVAALAVVDISEWVPSQCDSALCNGSLALAFPLSPLISSC